MMDEDTTQEDLKALQDAMIQMENEGTSPQTTETTTEEVTPEPEVVEDPLKVELEKVKSRKTPQEKAKDSLFFNAQKAKELGLDPAEILGIKPREEEVFNEDEKPLTRKDLLEALSAIKTSTATKTAEDLANEITNETERELTLFHIQNTIRSTGDPQEDLRNARALTNSVKNSQILEEASRKPQAKTHSSGSGATGGNVEPNVVLTPEEETYLATGHITKEEILLNRQGKLNPLAGLRMK